VKVFAFAQTGEGLPVNQAVVALEEAFAHRLAENFEQAEQDYIQIIQRYPDSDYAFAAQKGLTISYIAWGKPTQGQTALQELMADDIDDQQMASALRDVADHYRWFNDPKAALELYQYVIDNHPQEEGAMWSQVGIVILDISKGDYDAADAAVDKLVNGYYGYEKVADAVYEVAELYRDQQKQQKAYSLYRYVMDNWPNLDGAMWSQMRVSLISIEQEDYEVAQTAVNRLLADYLDHEKIVDAAHQIADLYRRQQKHQEAHSLYQYIVDNLPDKEIAFWTLEEAFDYRLDKDFEQAERIYTQLIQRYPDSDYAFAAQKGLTISYIASGKPTQARTALQELMSNDADGQQMASTLREVADHYRWFNDPKTALELYQYVIDNHPQEEGAMWSHVTIAMASVEQEDYEGADQAIDALIEDFAGNPNLPRILYDMARDHNFWYRWRFETCKKLLGYIIQNCPESDLMVGALSGYARANVRLGNCLLALETTNTLIVEFCENPASPELFYDLARDYRIAEECGGSQWLDQYVLDNFPDNQKAQAYAKLGLVIAKADSNGILVDWKEFVNNVGLDHPLLSELLIEAKKEYSVKGRLSRMGGFEERALRYFHQEAAICEERLRIYPASPDHTPVAHYLAAVVYGQDLHDYAKAVEHFQRVAEDWPEYRNAAHAQFAVGGYYKSQKNRGDISAAEAKPLIEQAYRAVIENYPDSPYAERAASKLAALE